MSKKRSIGSKVWGNSRLPKTLRSMSELLRSLAAGLFEKREGRLREERDSARIQAEAARVERDVAMAQVQEQSGKLEALTKDLQVSCIFQRVCQDCSPEQLLSQDLTPYPMGV